MRFLLTLLLVLCVFAGVSAQDSGRISATKLADPVVNSTEPRLLVMLQVDEQKKVEVASDGTSADVLGSEQIPLNWIESITLVTDRLELEPYGDKARDGILLITLKDGWKESELFKRYR